MVAANDLGAGPDVVCIGSSALDLLLVVEELPGADGRVPAGSGMMAGGGPAATAAVALARLGARVELVARVGDDAPGRLIREQLAAEGVGTRWLVAGADEARSALSSGIIRMGPPPTRSLVALAAGPALVLDDLPADAIAACRSARWLHVDHAGWPLVAGLRREGVDTPVAVDGGNPLDGFDPALAQLYVPSLAELRRWTGAVEPDAALGRALDAGAAVVVATQGHEGARYQGRLDPDRAWPAGGVTRDLDSGASPWRLEVPACPVEVRSTLGAGDVYHGALLAALIRGSTIRVAMLEAAVASALSCRAIDGRSAIPDRSELEAALDAWSPEPTLAWRSDA
ncbi:MAG: PfkB family carbohydrate kinase [Candidatus Limnocylindrales bacterium]